LICYILSHIIPAGEYQRNEDGEVIPGTYAEIGVKGIALWRVITAPVRVFASEDALTIIMISIFLLVMSGVFNLLDKTGGTKVFIARIIKRLADKGGPVVCVCTLVFMLFGSFFGMFEELVTLLPIVIMFTLALGMDSMTGLGVCMLGACFGFSAAITNPFSVGLVSQVVSANALSGAWLRIVFFGLIYLSLCIFLMRHLKKIEREPKLSPTYEVDLDARSSARERIIANSQNSDKLFRVFAIFFIVQILVLVSVASISAISGFAIPILSVSFLLGSIIAGLFVCEKKSDIFVNIGRGAVAMLPAVLMIALASSVKLVMSESKIIDTITNSAINALDGQGKFVSIIMIYLLTLILQFFIGSASAKIMLVVPIIWPICQQLGISPAMLVLTYCMADGFTDVIIPTNPILLVGLSMANVSYGKWVKWTWKLQLFLLLFTVVILYVATLIGY
jgi:uncharacterized ion transporter superfamily protein YfcC